MTIAEKKKILRMYRCNMAAVQRLKTAMETFEASAASIQKEIDRHIARAEEIEAFLYGIENIFQREILLRKFIFGETIEQIAEALCYSARHIQRIIDKAVSELKLELIA